MGLDQALWAHKCIHPIEFDAMSQKHLPNPKYHTLVEMTDSQEDVVDGYGWFDVAIPVAEWRKVNSIHAWFVKHIQNDKDDCGYYTVSPPELQLLCTTIEEAIEQKSSDRLPPTSGFFFGSTEVNEDYWEDLQLTLDTLQPLVDKYERFTYNSSW